MVWFAEQPVSRDAVRIIANRLRPAAHTLGVSVTHSRRPPDDQPAIELEQNRGLFEQTRGRTAEAYRLTINATGIRIEFAETGGLRAAVATLRQLQRQYGRRLPCLVIRDWPDFAGRGVMLDISRGRVPRLRTLKQLASNLADFKINELQLYLEHTFAYRRQPKVWQGEGALTAQEIRKLDAHCRALGIELIPNQNSFGHLQPWLDHPSLCKLAEVQEPWLDPRGGFVRHPATLAPNHPGTLPFLRSLYDELLPNFTSKRFNVGCDETWDLGRGRSRALCERQGKGRVYLDFLKKIHREVRQRGRTMMFWGDIILHYPELIASVPKDVIALNWGYDAGHPFPRETAAFAKAGLRFYVCPGTYTWQSMVGRYDNALVNLREAARAGRRNGAIGYLNTDWGDGGHPQPLAVSYPLYLAGASLSWNAKGHKDRLLAPVLSRDVFQDRTGRAARATLGLGLAHRLLKYFEPNATPLGATLAASPPAARDLFCRHGLKYFARVRAADVRAAQREVTRQRRMLAKCVPTSDTGRLLARELELAARMAEQSCQFILWQQALAAGDREQASKLARSGVRELKSVQRDLARLWAERNKGRPLSRRPFLDWRIADYRSGRLPYTVKESRAGWKRAPLRGQPPVPSL